MTDYLKLHTDGGDAGDDDVTRRLRQIYAAPQGDGYWRSLEARILSRLVSAPRISWWDELGSWMRPALATAAAVLFAAGIAMFRAHQAEQALASEAMLTPAALPVETAVRPMLQEQRETTFRYLMTSR